MVLGLKKTFPFFKMHSTLVDTDSQGSTEAAIVPCAQAQEDGESGKQMTESLGGGGGGSSHKTEGDVLSRLSMLIRENS